MGDDAAGHHVGAIANPRRVMTDGRGGDAEFLQVVEAGNSGAVAADAGVVEDRRDGLELRREVGGIDPAMRGIDDDRGGGFRPDAGDTVGDDDRSGHRCGLARGGDDPASCKHWLGATMETSVDPGRGFIRLAGLARLLHGDCCLEPQPWIPAAPTF